VRWASVEPGQNQYDWQGFDQMMSEAIASDKLVAYHISPGVHTPDWAYEAAGVKPFSYSYKESNPKKVKTYLPWVTIKGRRQLNTAMLQVWEKTIAAYSSLLHGHPNRDRIAYVAISGGPTSNGLEIMWQQSFYDEFKQVGWDVEAESLFIEYWKRCVDIFLRHFGDIPLGLAFTGYFGVDRRGEVIRNYAISQAIVDYALRRASERGAVVIPMSLWIGALNPNGYNSHPGIKLLRSFRAPFAFQGPMGTSSYSRLQKMLSFVLSSGASWMELWHHDVINPEYQPLLKKYRPLLRKEGIK